MELRKLCIKPISVDLLVPTFPPTNIMDKLKRNHKLVTDLSV